MKKKMHSKTKLEEYTGRILVKLTVGIVINC